MTVKELKNTAFTLAALTGENADRLFPSALKGALSKIYGDMRISGRKRIFVNRIPTLARTAKTVHPGGKVTTLPLLGRGYSFKVSGCGEFKIKDGDRSETVRFDSEERLFRGFISEGGEIEFSGEHLYYIYDFTLYSDTLGSEPSDIPAAEGGKRCIDLSKKGDLSVFLSLPRDSRGRVIPGSSYEDRRLFLPSDFEGEITVEYLKRPPEPSDFEDAEIDLPPPYEPLLLPLVVSYLLTDEERELSEGYASAYSAMAENLKRISQKQRVESVITDGWA